MAMALQGSLLDTADEIELHGLDSRLTRTELTRGAWVDYRPGWLSGADAALRRAAPRRALGTPRSARCTTAIVDIPRLLKFYAEGEQLPHRILTDARDQLSHWYAARAG